MGGQTNEIKQNSSHSVIVGGEYGSIIGSTSFIAGGTENQIQGDNNATLGGQQTIVKGNNNFVAGSNINFDPAENGKTLNNTFVWSDNLARIKNQTLTPTVDNSFYIRSAQGLGINTSTPRVSGADVQGMVQIGDQQISCTTAAAGVIRYTTPAGESKGCFCSCNGNTRDSITPSDRCISACGGTVEAPVCTTYTPIPLGGIFDTSSAPLCTKGTVANKKYSGSTWSRNCQTSAKTQTCSTQCAAGLIIDPNNPSTCIAAPTPQHGVCRTAAPISLNATLDLGRKDLCQQGEQTAITVDPTTGTRQRSCKGIGAGTNTQYCSVSCAAGTQLRQQG